LFHYNKDAQYFFEIEEYYSRDHEIPRRNRESPMTGGGPQSSCSEFASTTGKKESILEINEKVFSRERRF